MDTPYIEMIERIEDLKCEFNEIFETITSDAESCDLHLDRIEEIIITIRMLNNTSININGLDIIH